MANCLWLSNVQKMQRIKLNQMWRKLLRFLFPGEGSCCLFPYFMRRRPQQRVDKESLCKLQETSGQSDPPKETRSPMESAVVHNTTHYSNIFTRPAENLRFYEERLVSLVDKLTLEESVTSRLLARTILTMCYAEATPATQAYARLTYGSLCVDEDVCVRQVTVGKIVEFAKQVGVEFYAEFIIPIFNEIKGDKMEVVRLEAAQALTTITSFRHLSEGVRKNLFSVIKSYLEDPSWRIRYVIARNIIQIQETAGTPAVGIIVIQIYEQLLRDPASKVQATAGVQLPEFLNHLDWEESEITC